MGYIGIYNSGVSSEAGTGIFTVMVPGTTFPHQKFGKPRIGTRTFQRRPRMELNCRFRPPMTKTKVFFPIQVCRGENPKNTISGSDILTLPSAHCYGPIFEGASKMGPWQCALPASFVLCFCFLVFVFVLCPCFCFAFAFCLLPFSVSLFLFCVVFCL